MRPLTLILFVSLLLARSAPAAPLTVVATLFPLYEFAREVGKERVAVSLLLPPGTEAHTWDPRPSDLARLKEAGLFLYLGDFMETWAPKIIRSSGVKRSFAAGEGLLPPSQGAAEGGKGGGGKPRDPHIWLDFSLCARMVDSVAEELSRLDPAGSASYRENASVYKDRLIALDQAYRRGLGNCARREFVFGGHAAFGYLAARYGLVQVAVYGISPDSEPSPRAVAGIVKTVREKHLPVVYFEEMVNPRLAEVIAREAGARTLVLFPGHNLTSTQWKEGVGFLTLMERNLANLKAGLGCE